MTPELLEALLAPISPDQPAGIDISYAPECDEIRKLRKGDDPSLSQGEWVREIKTPQWPRVRTLCQDLLKTQSKDLQVACWHVEALTNLDGFEGLAFSLRVLDGLLTSFWETCYPVLTPGDMDERVAKVEWLNNQMPMVIHSIPMTDPKQGGYSWLRWEESKTVENLGARDPQARDAALADGKLSGEAWDKAVKASGPQFYVALFAHTQFAKEAIDALDQTVDRLFAVDSPGLEGLKEAIQGCLDLAGQMLKRHGIDPSGEMPDVSPEAPTQDGVPSAPTGTPGTTGPIQSRADAIRRLREVAQYFRNHEPHSPVGPLAERAANWGEMSLDLWLTKVVKDDATLRQLKELLDLQGE